jgi:hypothetical protein
VRSSFLNEFMMNFLRDGWMKVWVAVPADDDVV